MNYGRVVYSGRGEMNRIGRLTLLLLSLLLIIGIVSCKSEPIPTDRIQTVDFIIIWFEGKSIKLEKGNRNFDELLVIEAQRGGLYGTCPVNTSVIDSIRQNEKCLEIVYKDPHPMYKDNPDYVEFSKLLRLNKELSKEPVAPRYITYVEHSNGLGNSKSWSEFWNSESPDKLAKIVDKILGVAQ
jgi:hypothetical protein